MSISIRDEFWPVEAGNLYAPMAVRQKDSGLEAGKKSGGLIRAAALGLSLARAILIFFI